MLPLPSIPLRRLGWRNKVRLGRDDYVRLDTNDYSADPSVIGRLVDVSADFERVRVRAEGRIVADHVRVWARGPPSPTRRMSKLPRGCASGSTSPALSEESVPSVTTWSGT